MSPRPLVTVLLPVYNARPYVLGAAKSILAQDSGDFEFLVVNDGCTDGSETILSRLDDPRLRIVHQPHLGIVAALNHGLELARGELIARMDADDLALPPRLRLQAEFMQEHPQVHLLGTRFYYMDFRGQPLFSPLWPCDDEAIRRALPVYNCFTHPTVMFRRQSVLAVGGYRKELQYQEDYDLWLRLTERHAAAQLPQMLLYYRLSSGSISFRYRKQQSTVLDGMVKELARQRRSAGRDVLESGGDGAALRDALQRSAGPWAQRRRWGRQMCGMAEGCLEAGRRRQAMRFGLESAFNDPATRWNWTVLGRSCMPDQVRRMASLARRRWRRWLAQRGAMGVPEYAPAV